MKQILITSLTLFIFGITVGQTVSLHPTLEVSIDNLNPNSNEQYYPDFLANSWTYQGTPFNQRSLMLFDFSSIPNNATIISARLSLYGHPSNDNTQLSDPLSGSNASTLRRVTSSWNQNTVTWNNQPPVTATDDAALAESTSPMEDYLNIDIKNMVVDMINNGNYGLEMLLDTEAIYRCLLFATTYNSDTTVFPTLVITYSVIPPVASFQSSDSSICADGCINFTDHSSNATSWLWFFPGASPFLSTVENPQNICYHAAGYYDVMLIASNSNGSDTLYMTKYITVNASPPAPIIKQSGDTLFCSTDPTYTSYQWYYGNTPIPGATDTFLVAYYKGNYNVKVTNESGCSIAVGINVVIGINELEADSYFNLYPNPAANQLSIHISSSVSWQNVTISIINVLGQEASRPILLESVDKDAVIDISNLSAGMYFLQMKSESGNVVKRFVKE